jgi:hydrogenase small subunit
MRRPLAYGQRIHDKCPRRASFDAGLFADAFDDENARKGTACTGWDARGRLPSLLFHPGWTSPEFRSRRAILLGCTEVHFFDG